MASLNTLMRYDFGWARWIACILFVGREASLVLKPFSFRFVNSNAYRYGQWKIVIWLMSSCQKHWYFLRRSCPFQPWIGRTRMKRRNRKEILYGCLTRVMNASLAELLTWTRWLYQGWVFESEPRADPRPQLVCSGLRTFSLEIWNLLWLRPGLVMWQDSWLSWIFHCSSCLLGYFQMYHITWKGSQRHLKQWLSVFLSPSSPLLQNNLGMELDFS